MIEDSVVRTARRFALTTLLVSMASIAHAQGDLDRQRDAFCQVDKALDSIGLKPGMAVGQIGTDSGYLALKLAARVGPNGRVLASGTDRAVLESVKTTAARSKLAPVEPIVENALEDTSFPAGSLDAVFLFDTWTFFIKRLRDAAPALKPGGRAILIVMEDDARALDASGTPFRSEFLYNRRAARMGVSTRYAVDRIDDTTLPHHTLFVLSPKPEAPAPAVPYTVDELREELKFYQKDELEREKKDQLDKALDSVGVRPGMRVAEIGGGAGYLVEKLARRVGSEGKVYAEDVSSRALEVLKLRMAERQLANYETIIGSETNPRLPEGVLDMVFFHWTMPWVEAPVDLFRNITPALKPGGKIVLIEVEFNQVMGPGGDRGTDKRYRTREAFLDIFAKASFKVERIDSTTLLYRTIFVLSPARIGSSPGARPRAPARAAHPAQRPVDPDPASQP